MGDISQNIHFGYGLSDWEELKNLILNDKMDSFGILKKSYRNTIEISEFATKILKHGRFSTYPVEPIIRHGLPVQIEETADSDTLFEKTASVCKAWQQKGLETIAIVCRSRNHADETAKKLSKYIDIVGGSPDNAVFGVGVMVLPVEYTKGLEFDAVMVFNPTKEDYPIDDGHAKLLYVAATRALHELCILHTGNLTGLITEPVPESDDTHVINEETNNITVQPYAAPSSLNKGSSSRRKIAIAQSGKTTSDKSIAPSEAGKPIAKVHAIRQPDTQQATNQQSFSPHTVQQTATQQPVRSEPSAPNTELPEIAFGDMPATGKLRPAGHSKIDLAIRWISKQKDGLYMQSRYGVLRLCPIGSAIIRVSFAKGKQPDTSVHSKIAVNHIENAWLYKESASVVELMTDELCIQVDKTSGAIRYMTRDKKLLLAERSKECRQIDDVSVINKSWLFFDLPKGENIYGMGTADVNGLNLRNTARYISHGKNASELPFILSDKGYGILVATDNPTICCDIPAYGSYICTENSPQIDFYFIAGKQQKTIINAYAYLCGKL